MCVSQKVQFRLQHTKHLSQFSLIALLYKKCLLSKICSKEETHFLRTSTESISFIKVANVFIFLSKIIFS